MYLALYIIYNNSAQFGVLWGLKMQASDFESDEIYFRGFLHRYSFPYFLTRFLTDFLHIRHADFNGEHLSYLNKTNWPKVVPDRGDRCLFISYEAVVFSMYFCEIFAPSLI